MKRVDFIGQKMAARRMLGYLPQDFGLYPTLTAEQTLNYFARLKGVANPKERAALSPGGRPGEQFSPADATLEDYYFSLVNQAESVN